MGSVAKLQAAAPRLRLATTVDLSRADPDCDNCGGTGVVAHRAVVIPNEGDCSVPVICHCVSRAGGVKKDVLDAILEQAQQRLDDGTFAEQLADDIKKLPLPAQADAINHLQRRIVSGGQPPVVRHALAETLRRLGQGEA
jgi:hypothetical protein